MGAWTLLALTVDIKDGPLSCDPPGYRPDHATAVSLFKQWHSIICGVQARACSSPGQRSASGWPCGRQRSGHVQAARRPGGAPYPSWLQDDVDSHVVASQVAALQDKLLGLSLWGGQFKVWRPRRAPVGGAPACCFFKRCCPLLPA